MKFSSLTKLLTALTIGATLTAAAFAHNGQDHKNSDPAKGSVLKADAAGVTAEWLTQARAAYPLDSCFVSGDKFDGGDMGTPQDYVYRQEGHPDRLLRFCCRDCLKEFKEDSPKFLKLLDEAAAAKNKAGSTK